MCNYRATQFEFIGSVGCQVGHHLLLLRKGDVAVQRTSFVVLRG